MDKSKKENILNKKVENLDVLHKKDPMKSNALGSNGMKLSINMTSQDKKEFLLKFEEWRKSRREKFVNTVSQKEKEIVKSSKLSNSSLPLRNKSNDISVFDKKSDEVETSERKESVFERLCKNAKKVRNEDTKPPQISREVLKKPRGLDVIKTNTHLRVSQKKTFSNSSYQANKVNTSFKTDQTSLRRSISMIYRKQSKMSSATRQKSLSEKSLLEMKSSYHYAVNDSNIKSVSRPASSSYIREKLDDWLELKGDSLESYRHLRCFDIVNDKKKLLDHNSTKPDKGDPSTSNCDDTFSQPLSDEASQENISDVENWLKELYRLIVEAKYPSDRCEEWLSAIKKKWEGCEKSYLYWECVTALGESKCNVESAVTKKPEVDETADSLTELFDRMVIEQQKPSKTKQERGLDVKIIFQSTVIKFALQEKTVKESDSNLGQDVQKLLYVATPVRRSSRIKTPCKSHVVSSLQSVSPEVRKNLTFKLNDSLLE